MAFLHVDEQAVHFVQEAVGGRAVHGPRRRQFFVRRQDLFDRHVERLPSAARPRTAARRQQIAHVRLQARDVVDRIDQAVGMIDAQAGHLAFADQPQNQAVRGLEHRRIFHAHAGQLVHVEEAPVVDFVRRRPPVGQPVVLLVEQRVQPIEAARIAGAPFHTAIARSMCSRTSGRRLGQAHQPFARDFLFAMTLDHLVGIALGRRRQVLQRRDDAEEFAQVRIFVAQLFAKAFDVVFEQHDVAPRIERQHAIEVVQDQRAIAEAKLQLAAFEHGAVLIAEDRQQHLVGQLRLDRRPVDVEEARVDRARPVLEHVAPPVIALRLDAHVVRHDVEHEPHPRLRERVRQRVVGASPPSSSFSLP